MARVEYDSNHQSLTGEIIACLFLSVITLGFYIPFAKTRLRKVAWSRTLLDGHRFHFAGNPWVLFRSYLIVLAIYFIGGTLLTWIAQFVISLLENVMHAEDWGWSYTAIAFVIGLATNIIWIVVIAVGSFLGVRYLARCTIYRNHHVHMSRAALPYYMKTMLIGFVLTVITLGIYYPWLSYRLKKIKIESLSYGQHKFKLTLHQAEYVGQFFFGLIVTILTLGIYYPFWMANLFQLTMDRMKVGEAQVTCRVDKSSVFGRAVLFVIANIFTIGIASLFAEFFFLRPLLTSLDVQNLEAIDFNALVAPPEPQVSGFWDAVNSIIGDGDLGFPL